MGEMLTDEEKEMATVRANIDSYATMHGCDAKAVKEQILAHYQAMGIPPDTRLRSGIVTSRRSQPPAGTRLGIP